jgi:alpha/beta superfamily hydrolase
VSEHHHTSAVVSWFKRQYPNYKDCIIGIPNGAHIAGNARQRAIKINKLKSEGFKVGASDLFIAVRSNGRAGLWLEMKDEGKSYSSLSKNQKEHLILMDQMGYKAAWAAGFDSAKEIVAEYMGPHFKNDRAN